MDQMDKDAYIPIIGIRGDAMHCPQDTVESYWAALGAGASGLAVSVSQTKDGVLVCSSNHYVSALDSNYSAISSINYSELKQYDFGINFSAKNNATEKIIGYEKNTRQFPWMRNINSKTGKPKFDAVSIATLEEVLTLFSRRTIIHFYLDLDTESFIDDLIQYITRFNLNRQSYIIASFTVCKRIVKKYPAIQCSLIHNNKNIIDQTIADARKLKIKTLYIPIELITCRTGLHQATLKLITNNNLRLHIYNDSIFSCDNFTLLESIRTNILAVFTPSILDTMNSQLPNSLIINDNFEGKKINRNLWSAGYSSVNDETEILHDNGIVFNIKPGTQYSGGGLVTLYPIHGQFDARVTFDVNNPEQGTTFELAAIGIDPGYYQIDNKNLNRKSVHLSFDVHGTPPYASSERDENDGFRCGWNNSLSLAKVNSDNQLNSINAFNKYGRDVGNAEKDNQHGQLRLIRQGSIFTSYYKDKYNNDWVNSGSMLVPNLPSDIHIRIAAKHWPKKGTPAPHNTIRFTNFKLFQR